MTNALKLIDDIKTAVLKDPELSIPDVAYVISFKKTKVDGSREFGDTTLGKVFVAMENVSKSMSNHIERRGLPIGRFEEHKDFDHRSFFTNLINEIQNG